VLLAIASTEIHGTRGHILLSDSSEPSHSDYQFNFTKAISSQIQQNNKQGNMVELNGTSWGTCSFPYRLVFLNQGYNWYHSLITI
jgi:hypothetical protein